MREDSVLWASCETAYLGPHPSLREALSRQRQERGFEGKKHFATVPLFL